MLTEKPEMTVLYTGSREKIQFSTSKFFLLVSKYFFFGTCRKVKRSVALKRQTSFGDHVVFLWVPFPFPQNQKANKTWT